MACAVLRSARSTRAGRSSHDPGHRSEQILRGAARGQSPQLRGDAELHHLDYWTEWRRQEHGLQPDCGNAATGFGPGRTGGPRRHRRASLPAGQARRGSLVPNHQSVLRPLGAREYQVRLSEP